MPHKIEKLPSAIKEKNRHHSVSETGKKLRHI